MSNTTAAKLYVGDYVQTQKYGYRGRVTKTHPSCPQDRAWIAGQSIPLTDEELKERWVSVLVHGGGAVVVPESDCVVVEAFAFENDYADEHFRPAS